MTNVPGLRVILGNCINMFRFTDTFKKCVTFIHKWIIDSVSLAQSRNQETCKTVWLRRKTHAPNFSEDETDNKPVPWCRE